MICGLCGSGISAEEKYKQLKDGTVAKYIYYGCGHHSFTKCVVVKPAFLPHRIS